MCIWVIMDKHDYLFFAFSLCDKSPRSAKVNLFFSLLAEVLSKDNNLEKVHQGYIIKGKARPDLDTCTRVQIWPSPVKKFTGQTCPNLTVFSEKIYCTRVQIWPCLVKKFTGYKPDPIINSNHLTITHFFLSFIGPLSCSFHELVCRVRRVV